MEHVCVRVCARAVGRVCARFLAMARGCKVRVSVGVRERGGLPRQRFLRATKTNFRDLMNGLSVPVQDVLAEMSKTDLRTVGLTMVRHRAPCRAVRRAPWVLGVRARGANTLHTGSTLPGVLKAYSPHSREAARCWATASGLTGRRHELARQT